MSPELHLSLSSFEHFPWQLVDYRCGIRTGRSIRLAAKLIKGGRLRTAQACTLVSNVGLRIM